MEQDVKSVAFSPDGKYVLSGGSDVVMLWDIETGKEIRTFTGHTKDVSSVVFSPDGKFALSGGNTLNLWDIASGKRAIGIYKGSIVLPTIFTQ